MKFSRNDYRILDRHYKKYNFLGFTFRVWDTSPAMILEHLKEVERLERFSKIVSDEISPVKSMIETYKANKQSCFIACKPDKLRNCNCLNQ